MTFTPEFFTSHKAALAPLAGYSDSAFRTVCRACGSVFTVSEMISADGLVRNVKKTKALMRFTEPERPYGIQLYGVEPETIADAVTIAETMNPDFIDLNCGCPARKVVKRGSGAAFMGDLKRMEAVFKAMRSRTNLPLTAKFRIGIDHKNITVGEAARIAEACGFTAVTVHARSLKQGFTGQADWKYIELAKKSVNIPVIGNGDVKTCADAVRMMSETNCDAVMIGRGAYGKPWLFAEIADENFRLTPENRLKIVLIHYNAMLADKPLNQAVREMRKHLIFYSKGMDGAGEFRRRIVTLENPDDVLKETTAFFTSSS